MRHSSHPYSTRTILGAPGFPLCSPGISPQAQDGFLRPGSQHFRETLTLTNAPKCGDQRFDKLKFGTKQHVPETLPYVFASSFLHWFFSASVCFGRSALTVPGQIEDDPSYDIDLEKHPEPWSPRGDQLPFPTITIEGSPWDHLGIHWCCEISQFNIFKDGSTWSTFRPAFWPIHWVCPRISCQHPVVDPNFSASRTTLW